MPISPSNKAVRANEDFDRNLHERKQRALDRAAKQELEEAKAEHFNRLQKETIDAAMGAAHSYIEMLRAQELPKSAEIDEAMRKLREMSDGPN
jgi:hypothetical protein